MKSSQVSKVSLADPEAFRAFYEQALPRVYSYLYPRCGGIEAVAEDLTQTTFLAAVREIRKGQVVKSPVPWVLGIARHKLHDFYRARAREERNLALAWRVRPVEDDRISWADEAGATKRALAALRSVPAAQGAALALRYLDGMSVPEVAHALGRSVRATESLLARGRESFKRSYLEGQHG